MVASTFIHKTQVINVITRKKIAIIDETVFFLLYCFLVSNALNQKIIKNIVNINIVIENTTQLKVSRKLFISFKFIHKF